MTLTRTRAKLLDFTRSRRDSPFCGRNGAFGKIEFESWCGLHSGSGCLVDTAAAVQKAAFAHDLQHLRLALSLCAFGFSTAGLSSASPSVRRAENVGTENQEAC